MQLLPMGKLSEGAPLELLPNKSFWNSANRSRNVLTSISKVRRVGMVLVFMCHSRDKKGHMDRSVEV
jgi:hypothetical protein